MFRVGSIVALVAGLISLYGIVHKQGETIGNQGGTIRCLRGVIVEQQDEITARDALSIRQQAQIDGLAAQLQAHGIQPLYVGAPAAGQPSAPPPATATTPTTQARRGSTTTTTHPPTTTTTTSLVPVITLPTLPVVAASVSQQSC